MKHTLSKILYYSGISKLLLIFLLRNRPSHFIFMYHRINKNGDSIFTGLDVSIFEKQVACLKKYFSLVILSQFINLIGNTNKPLAVITFDDGYKNTLDNAYPILRKYEVPANVFLTTGPVINEDMLWTDKLNLLRNEDCSVLEKKEHLKTLFNKEKDTKFNKVLSQSKIDLKSIPTREKMLSVKDVNYMTKNGIEFGAHTINHPILTNIDIGEAKKEIAGSKLEIESITRRTVTTFCYPNGKTTDFNKNITQLLKEEGFECAVTSIEGKVTSFDNRFELKRISLGDRDPGLVILRLIKEILKNR